MKYPVFLNGLVFHGFVKETRDTERGKYRTAGAEQTAREVLMMPRV